METELSTAQAVVGALLIAVLLAGLHLAAARIRRQRGDRAGAQPARGSAVAATAGTGQQLETRQREAEPSAGVYWLHLGSFMVYNAILLHVFEEEVTSNRRSSFPWFLTGLVLYAGLLALVTTLAE